jgi:hypothetical protein
MSARTFGCTARSVSGRSIGWGASGSACGRCPSPGRISDRRFVIRVPPQPYVHVDRNDYSLDPRLVGRRVELRVSQREVLAVALDTGELAAKHRRVFAAGQELTDPAHQQALEQLRLARYRGKPVTGEEVEVRDLSIYDQLAEAA